MSPGNFNRGRINPRGRQQRVPEMLRALLAIFFVLIGTGAVAEDNPISSVPRGYTRVWSDEFTALSLRTGGPTYRGLESGSGTWSSPGAWYSEDPRGVAGYGGYDWFTDPSFYGWPPGYHGQLTITREGLRIRAEPPLAAMSTVLPTVDGKGGITGGKHERFAPWLAGQISSFHAVRIRPPFYFEVRAKMPAGRGRPFAAIFLNTEAPHLKNYEIDVHEGFGDSDRLHAGIHWDAIVPTRDAHDYQTRKVVDESVDTDLSNSFNTWGCEVTREQQIFYFNGEEKGRVKTPAGANVDQPYGILMDVSAGLPWEGGGAPSGGPHEMIIRYVRLYALEAGGLTLRRMILQPSTQ